MTCKVSFFNSIRENLKHHIASTFACILTFFIQFLIFFLQIQNLANWREMFDPSDLTEILEPNYTHFGMVIFVAIILAFDYFRYLHSKKQLDFYESLPVRRCDWFAQKTVTSFLVFFVPFMISILMQCVLLFAYGFTDTIYFTSIFWNVICMILTYLVTWITAVLAMIMTGHPIVATLGFAVFCGYAPILLQYIFPLYANNYFETYVDNTNTFLTYISPIGASVHLLGRGYHEWILNEHIKDLFILVGMILLLFLLTYKLFVKRPSEAAARAMAFEKCNPVIRILLVIPLSLYLGLYLSNVSEVATTIWMIVGFILGVILLHGIIESIFQFDIRGLWSHKLQMISCLAATIGIACIFWFDLFGYDTYIPKFEKIETIGLKMSDPYFYNYSNSDGLHGSQMELAYNLIEDIIDETHYDNDCIPIRIKYTMKNGVQIERRYRVDLDKQMGLVNQIYATEDYKNDICELYNIKDEAVINISWLDGITSYPLTVSSGQIIKLFETYINELTPLTYTEVTSTIPYGNFQVNYYNENGYKDAFHCYVFPQMEQSAAILQEMLEESPLSKNYGDLEQSALDRYEIASLDLYFEDDVLNITDSKIIASLKSEIIVADDYFLKYGGYETDSFYDGSAELHTYDGRNYVSILIPRSVVEPYIK